MAPLFLLPVFLKGAVDLNRVEEEGDLLLLHAVIANRRHAVLCTRFARKNAQASAHVLRQLQTAEAKALKFLSLCFLLPCQHLQILS
jgi:hypothetical protein